MTHKPDREKVIKECEWAIGRIEDYGSTTMTSRLFFADVAKLLKDQKEQIEILRIANDKIAEYLTQSKVVRCKDCIHYRYYGLSKETISECTIDHTENPDGDWFCADGERKSD
jgi:hypothetical protein